MPTEAQVMATRVLALQPSSFGARANAVPARVPALCLPSGHLELRPILLRCTALERLSLAGLHRIACDGLLRTVAVSCPRLQEVVLDYCGGVTEAGLEVRRKPQQRCWQGPARHCGARRNTHALPNVRLLGPWLAQHCAELRCATAALPPIPPAGPGPGRPRPAVHFAAAV